MSDQSPHSVPIDPSLQRDEQDDRYDSAHGRSDDLDDFDHLDGLNQDQQLSSGLEGDSDDAYIGEDEDGREKTGTEAAGIEDDAVFSRLAGYVSRTGKGAEVDMGGLNMEAEMALAEAEDLPAQTRPRTRAAVKPRKPHKPSHEVQRIVGQANMAYARGEIQRTIDLFLEVIRHDPYVISAWNTLASLYEDTGNEEGARQMRFFAAHVEDDVETWKELSLEFRQRGQIAQCIYCLRKVLSRDPGDVGVLFELASIYRLQNDTSKATESFKKILRLHGPSTFDFTFLAQFHPVLISGNNVQLAATSLRTSFDYHIHKLDGPDDPDSTMQLEHVIMLADDLIQLDNLEEAVSTIRRGQRWLQERSDQKQWDSFDDDREYDLPGTQRGEEGEDGAEPLEGYPLETPLRHRLALLRLRLGDDDEAMMHIEEILNLDVMQYHNLFLELGNALLKREMWERALDCLAVIQECDGIPDDPSHIYSIAICHHQMKDYPQALEALEWVTSVDHDNLEAKLRMANVLEDMGRKTEALEIVSEVIKERAQRGDRNESRQHDRNLTKGEKAGQRKLTKRVLEDQMRSKMQNLWEDVQSAEEGIAGGNMGALERFIYAAGTMVENYRLAKGNFTKNRGVMRVLKQRKHGSKTDLASQAMALQDRLERTMGFEDDAPIDDDESGSKTMMIRVTEFYGLGCEEWLNLVIKYCCVLMVKNEEDVAMDILEHVIWSGLFNNRRSEVALRITIVACSMRMKAYEKIVDNCKRLAQIHQFRPEPFLLLLSSISRGGSKAAAAWQNLQLQKYLHRDLRIHDSIVKGHKTNFNVQWGRWTTVGRIGLSRRLGDNVDDEEGEEGEGDEDGDGGGDGGDDEDEENEQREDRGANQSAAEVLKPTKFSPTLNVIYGQHMLSARAYQSALFYFFRAYKITQQDAFLCLLIAQAFLGRATNRQSDNRNYQIVQALAFLTKYRKLSAQDVLTREQVEYNFARSYHGVGVPHLAIEHYERVLSSVQRRMDESDDPNIVRHDSLAPEAAHNLIILYSAVGSVQLCKERSKWLAI